MKHTSPHSTAIPYPSQEQEEACLLINAALLVADAGIDSAMATSKTLECAIAQLSEIAPKDNSSAIYAQILQHWQNCMLEQADIGVDARALASEINTTLKRFKEEEYTDTEVANRLLTRACVALQAYYTSQRVQPAE